MSEDDETRVILPSGQTKEEPQASGAPNPLQKVRDLRRRSIKSADVIDINARREPPGGGSGPGGGGGEPEPNSFFNPRNHWQNALDLLDQNYTLNRHRTLLDHNGLWAWSIERGWAEQREHELDASIYPFFHKRPTTDRSGKVVEFHVNAEFTNNLTRALRARLVSHVLVNPPCHLLDVDGCASALAVTPVSNLIPVANGLVDCTRMQLFPPTPAFFSYGVSPVAFDPEQKCPTWLEFNRQIFDGDHEMMQAAQQFAGYVLSDQTKLQKIGWIIGPSRSGKGTWVRLIQAVIGPLNVAGPDFQALASPFGLEPLIGKKLATFGDAKLPDVGDRSAILAKILSISGEDTQTIGRKFKPAWSGRLCTRLFFLSNELPEFNDTSNAFANRVILLRTTKDRSGCQDIELENKLMAELPGILNWMLVGLQQVWKQGFIIQPSASIELMNSLRHLSSPMSQFLAECCSTNADDNVETGLLYEVHKAWNAKQGTARRISQPQFGKQLRSAVPCLSVAHPRPKKLKEADADTWTVREPSSGQAVEEQHQLTRRRVYVGVGLNDYGKSLVGLTDEQKGFPL